MIVVTNNAKDKFRQQLKQRGKGLGIRLDVVETGCSGYAYKIDFADEWKAEDFLSIHDDVYIWVTKKAYPLLSGLTVDYIKKGLNEQFEFINPNETGRCGCGESFTI